MLCGLLPAVSPVRGQEADSQPVPSQEKRVPAGNQTDAERLQKVREEAARRRAARRAEAEQASGVSRYDLEFPGGTPAQLVAAIRKASEGPCNLVIASNVAELSLPPLSLNSTTTTELLIALAQMFSQTGMVTLSPGGSNVNETTVWILYRNSRVSCRVTNIEFLLAAYTVDEITNALTTAWKLQGREQPKYVYDKASGLLMVTGDDRQLELMNEVLVQMNEGVKKRARDKSASVPPAMKSASTK